MGHAQSDSPRVIAAALTLPRADARTELAARALALARSTALGVLGDPSAAEDVAQEVAIVALERSPRDPAKLDAWLHRVAVRKAIDETRRRKRHPTVALDESHEIGVEDEGLDPRARAPRPLPHASAPR